MTAAELRGLMEKATREPWKPCRVGNSVIREAVAQAPSGPILCTLPNDLHPAEREANAALIAAMRNALPALLAVVEAAEKDHAACDGERAAGIKAHPCKLCDALAELAPTPGDAS